MNRKSSINNSNNRLLYDPNHDKERRLGTFSMQEDLDEEETPEETENTGEDSIEETPESNENIKDNDGQSETKEDTNSTRKEVAKTAVKEGAKQAGKAAGQAATKATGAVAAKIGALIAANPWILLILVVVLILFLIIFILAGDIGTHGNGYYDSQCNYNESVVTLKACNTGETTEMPLDKYVIGATYSLIKDDNYPDEAIKALMIVVKTNALGYGGYSSSEKDLILDDCSNSFVRVSDDDSELYNHLTEIYTEIENILYVSSSYKDVITSMSLADTLIINENIINEMGSLADEGNQYGTILNNIYNNDKNTINNTSATIYIGDSRIQSMLLSGAIDSANTVYGSGYGYNWFIGNGTYSSSNTNATTGAISAINSKISGGSYNIVIWLGVNDYSSVSAEQYYNSYYELATNDWKNQNIYIVSIGPVDDNLATNFSNSGINNFNNEMKKLIGNTNVTNLHFIDLDYSIQSYDNMGVNYGNDDYINIHKQINNRITTGKNVDLSVYNLTDYCMFYTVTENDAYWWPIGSSTATNGNIYGGNPSTTYISSQYGPRTINGIYGFHNGIDIAATCNENVIIATKSGTVTAVNDSCSSYGSYQDDCGSGYGNYVIIDHGGGTSSVYAHMYLDSITVQVGDTVQQGEKIGMMGSSGSSTGCHLHFGIKINDSPVNPLNYISADNPRPIVKNITVNAGSEGGQQAVCRALLDSGFSETATIGIMVNINAESGFRTDAVEYASGYTIDNIYNVSADEAAGFGLFQWSFGRRINVINYARNNGMSPTSLQAQLEYFVQELNSSYPVTLKYVTGNYSAYDIATNFCLDFERPANKSTTCPTRASKYVNTFTEYVKNGCS